MKLRQVSESIQRIPIAGSLIRAFIQSRQKSIKDKSASIAYFSFFSIFPLVLGIVAVASFFIDPVKVSENINKIIAEVIPGSADLVSQNINSIVRLRGAISLVSIVTLLWSGSKMFSALSRSVNNALGLKRPFIGVLDMFRNIVLAALAILLLLIPLAVTPLVHIIESLEMWILGDKVGVFLSYTTADSINFGSSVLVMTILYWIIPYRLLSWRIVVPAAFFTSLFLLAGKSLFMLYLNSTAHFKAIYGSLSSIVVLLLWLYYSSYLIIFGAELMAIYMTDRSEKTETNGDEIRT